MDPFTLISAGISVAGFVTNMFGEKEKNEGAQQQFEAQKNITNLETQQDAVRRKAMEVNARRQQMEILRNQQRARSMALNSATNQGAQFGSGLSGGYGQIAGQTGVNLLGVSQGLQAGENMFDLNAQIGQQKIAYAQAGSQIATGAGMNSLGNSLMNSAGGIKSLGQNMFAGSNPANSGQGGQGYGSFVSGLGMGGIM